MGRFFAPFRLLLLASFLTLTACGGGGGSDSSSNPGTPSPQPDTTPDSITFSSVTDADWEIWVESEAVTIQGIDQAIDIAIEGGEYAINGEAFTAADGQVANGDSLVVRVMTSPEFETETQATVTVGPLTAIFSVTTDAEREKPTAAVAFPHLDGLVTRLSYNGNPALVTLRGTAADNVAVQRVTVGGVDASPASGDSLENWTADVYLSDVGESTLIVEVEDVNGNINTQAATRNVTVTDTPAYGICGPIAYDAANNRVLKVTSKVTATDITTGASTHYPVSGNYHGSAFNAVTGILYAFDIDGNVFEVSLSNAPDNAISWDGTSGISFKPGMATIDSATNTLYMLNSSFGISEWAVYSVDLASGVRAVVTSDNYGSGEDISDTFGISAANGRLFAHSRLAGEDRILEVDLATGNRTVISGAGVGNGYGLNWTHGFTVGPLAQKAYIGDFYDEIIEVDLASGDRRLVSAKYDHLDTNLVFEQGFGMAMNADAGELYLNCSASDLIAISLTTGERRQVTPAVRGQGVPMNNGQAVRYDSVNDRVLLINGVYQSYAPEIMSVDPVTGDRAIVTSEVTGSGAQLERFNDFAVDEVSGDIYLAMSWWDSADRNALVRVDPENGDRFLVSGNGRGLGPVFSEIQTVELVEEESVAYVLDTAVGAIFSIDLASGDRQVFTQPGSAGSGVDWTHPTYMALNQDKTRLYVSEQSTASIYQVDLATGHREVFSSDTVGEGPTLGEVTQIRLDAFRNKLVVQSYSISGAQPMVYVDLETGDRTYRESRNVNTSQRAGVDPKTGFAYMTDYNGTVQVYDYESRQALILSQ